MASFLTAGVIPTMIGWSLAAGIIPTTGWFLAEMTIAQGVSIIMPAIVAVGIFLATTILATSRANRSRIEQIALDVRTLQTQVSPFWASLQTKIADSLHNPDKESKDLDELLEKLEAMTLTPEELIILELQMSELQTHGSPDLAAKATTLLAVMKMKVKETAGKLPPTDQRSMEQKKAEV